MDKEKHTNFVIFHYCDLIRKFNKHEKNKIYLNNNQSVILIKVSKSQHKPNLKFTKKLIDS